MTLSALEVSESETATESPSRVETPAKNVLESTAIRATFWTVMDYGCSMALRVVNSLVLTRLLMPESFGLMALVTTFVVGISLMSDMGLDTSVIQNSRGDDPVLLNTVWTLQILRGAGIFCVSLFLAWPISVFYHEPRLIELLPALGATVLISGFNSTNLYSMHRHMCVRRVFLFDVSSQFLGLLITLCCALLYPSVWALVVGSLAGTVFKLVLSYYRRLIPGIRNSFCWDRENIHDLVHFGKWILLATAFYFFASQADRLILGRLVSLSLLGVYGIAYSVSDIPRAIITALATRVGFPFVAKMAHLSVPKFRIAFLHYRFRALLAGAGLLCLMVHLGSFLLTRMYDSRYHAASWMVPVLALGLWHTLLYSTTHPALLALGKAQYGAIGNACYCVTIITAIPLAFHFYGMFGAVVAIAAGDFPLYLVFVAAASREGVSTWRQDLSATAVFLIFLGLGQALHKAVLG